MRDRFFNTGCKDCFGRGYIFARKYENGDMATHRFDCHCLTDYVDARKRGLSKSEALASLSGRVVVAEPENVAAEPWSESTMKLLAWFESAKPKTHVFSGGMLLDHTHVFTRIKHMIASGPARYSDYVLKKALMDIYDVYSVADHSIIEEDL